MEKLYTTAQVAEIMNVNTYTVYRWIKEGMLVGIKRNGLKRWYVRHSDLESFVGIPEVKATKSKNGEKDVAEFLKIYG